MRCPYCRKALSLKTFFTQWRRKSSVRCHRCGGLARYEGRASWYGPTILAMAVAYVVAFTELPKFGIAPSHWLRSALALLAFWSTDALSRQFVALGPDPAPGEAEQEG